MQRNALTTVLAVFTILATFGCGPCEEQVAAPTVIEPPTDGVFIHISHGPEEPHRVLMALRMAELMAADKDVLVYFDITGIEVVLSGAEPIEHATFPPSGEQIPRLLELGVPLYACPGCLQAAGKTADDLMDGIQVANKDAFFNFTDGRIITLDY
jgi:predicted peroxiredoxin